MPKKNQQNKPNGFVMYANENKTRLLKEGHTIRNMPDLISAAAPKWKALPAEEKEYYKDKAKWEWDNRHVTGSYPGSNRMDSRGEVVKDRVDTVQLNQQKRDKERQEVFMSFPPGKGVMDQKFYFVSFVCLLEEPAYQPLELGVVEFSLLHGIERSMHKHIDPGPIPIGYRFMAEQHSELIHKLPIEGKMDPRDNYTKIYDQLFGFLSRGTRHIPPIFVKKSDCEKVESCLKWLATNAGRLHQLKRVYELEGLMLDLDNHLNDLPQNLLQYKQSATEILSSSVFDWDSGTRCAFHEDEENETESKYCALGNVNRHCYCIADFFCKNHNIKITDRHLPTNKSDVYYTVIPSKDSKANRTKRFNHVTQPYNDYQEHQQKPSTSSEDIAHKVAERLRLEVESQDAMEKRTIDEEASQKQAQEEQRKRWISLRGGGATYAPSTQPAVQSNATVEHNPITKPTGRGRGRGAIAINNLRRPGEVMSELSAEEQTDSSVADRLNIVKPPPGFGRSVGRGTKLHVNTNTYAGSSAAPHASEAPKPPTSWTS